MIRKSRGKYVLYSMKVVNGKRKKLGTFPSMKKAKDREKQINFFKHQNEKEK